MGHNPEIMIMYISTDKSYYNLSLNTSAVQLPDGWSSVHLLPQLYMEIKHPTQPSKITTNTRAHKHHTAYTSCHLHD